MTFDDAIRCSNQIALLLEESQEYLQAARLLSRMFGMKDKALLAQNKAQMVLDRISRLSDVIKQELGQNA